MASDFTDAVDQEPVLMANMEAGGTWVMIKSMEDCRQALNNTAHWYLLGRTAANFERYVLRFFEVCTNCANSASWRGTCKTGLLAIV